MFWLWCSFIIELSALRNSSRSTTSCPRWRCSTSSGSPSCQSSSRTGRTRRTLSEKSYKLICRSVLVFLQLGSGCSTVVEHTPRGREVVGSNSAGCWAFFSSLSYQKYGLYQVPGGGARLQIFQYKIIHAWLCSLRQNKLNTQSLSKKSFSSAMVHFSFYSKSKFAFSCFLICNKT